MRYHELQARLWRTSARFVAVAAGRGSGKTELARRRVVRMLPVRRPWPRPMYFYGMPTYRQARRVAWQNILDLTPKHWVAKINTSEMLIETTFGSQLYVVGLDNPQRIEGDQWDGGVLDESCDQRPGVFDLSVLPALTHRDGWCWRIGVPKRAGCGAHDFRTFCEERCDEFYTWSSEDILSPAQIEQARSIMSDKDYNEQFRAKWETASGAVFYAFDDVLNVTSTISYDPHLPIIVGSDFNVDPMAWVIGQHHRGADQLHVIDELYIRNTNTRSTLDALHAKYSTHQAGFIFTGDATSRARNTRASSSDYLQIKNDRRFHNSEVLYAKHNPPRADRFAACNAAFRSADDRRRCVIHPRCVNLITDLKARAYSPGTSEPDDYGDVSHASDALGYMIMRVYPLRLHAEESTSEVFASVH